MKTFSPKNLTRQAGVSLAETMIVTVVVGALSVLTYSQFGNSSALVKAKTTYETSQKIAESWSYITGVLDATPLIATSGGAANGTAQVFAKGGVPGTAAVIGTGYDNPILSQGSSALDAVIRGNDPLGLITPSYAAAYVASGIKPLADIVSTIAPTQLGAYSGGTGTVSRGKYSINGFPIAMTSSKNTAGQWKITIQLDNVSSEIAQVIWNQKNNSDGTGIAYWGIGAQGTKGQDKVAHSGPDAQGRVTLYLSFQA